MQSDGLMLWLDYEQQTLQGIIRLVFEAAMDLWSCLLCFFVSYGLAPTFS